MRLFLLSLTLYNDTVRGYAHKGVILHFLFVGTGACLLLVGGCVFVMPSLALGKSSGMDASATESILGACRR